MKKLLTIIAVLFTTMTFGQNVGISISPTFTPDRTLDVDGTLQVTGEIRIGETSGTNNDIYISDDIIDWDNSTYLIDPSSADSRFNEISFDVSNTADDPSIWFAGDPNTGFYQLNGNPNTLGFVIDGVESMRINSSRNLGIGTTAPSEKLDVNGDIRDRGLSGTGFRTVMADDDGVLVVNPNIGISPIDDCSFSGPYNVRLVIYYGDYGNENSWQLRDEFGNIIVEGFPGNWNEVYYDDIITLNYGTTYELTLEDSWGDGWNGGYFELFSPVNWFEQPTGSFNIATYAFGIELCTETPTIQRIIRGNVQSDGSFAGGGGFSLTAIGSGQYEIVFTTPFSDRPSATVTQVFSDFDSNGWGGSTLDNAIITHLDATKMRVRTGNGSGTGSDRDFSFIVVGSE